MGDETSNRGGGEAFPRSPTLTDLARICAELNRLNVRYVVVGGLAVIQAGYFRATEDIDLLVGPSQPRNCSSTVITVKAFSASPASSLRVSR